MSSQNTKPGSCREKRTSTARGRDVKMERALTVVETTALCNHTVSPAAKSFILH